MKKFYLALAVTGALLLAALGLARCHDPGPPAPPPVTSPMPASTAIASSSTATTLTNDLEIVFPPRRVAQNPYTAVQTRPAEPQIQQPRDKVVDEFPKGSYSVVQEDPIVIRIRQTATAAASSEASVSDSPMLAEHAPMTQDHARLGVIVGTVPGVIAISYQVASVEIPPWVLGTPLELGLEVEGNAQQLGAGVSLGAKAFATAGGYVGWAGPSWYVGLGTRF